MREAELLEIEKNLNKSCGIDLEYTGPDEVWCDAGVDILVKPADIRALIAEVRRLHHFRETT